MYVMNSAMWASGIGMIVLFLLSLIPLWIRDHRPVSRERADSLSNIGHKLQVLAVVAFNAWILILVFKFFTFK
jgi:hypothetical protein